MKDLARSAWSQALPSPGMHCLPYRIPGETFDCQKPPVPATEWTPHILLSWLLALPSPLATGSYYIRSEVLRALAGKAYVAF